jgi:PAS domain S-box-containing protein
MILTVDSFGHGSERLNAQLLVDSIPALIHTAWPDGYLDYFNKPWLEYLGVTLDKVTGWNWTAFVHPEDVEGIVAKWRACLATGEIFEYETRVRRANGEYRWMFHRKVPLRDANGNIVKWYGSSLDIEERKQAEEKLRRSERDLHSIIETIPTMVWSAAPDGSVDFFNPRWLDCTGLSPDKSRDWRWTAAIHPDDLIRLTDAWRSILVSGEPGETEARLRRFDGAYRWFLFRANALRDEFGKIVKWYGTNVDIEDRKQAEEELRRSEFYLSEGQRLAHMGSWALDPDGFYYWSPELFRMHGLDPASKPPSVQEYLDRVHQHDRESMADLINGILAKSSTFDATKRIVRPNGEVRYIRCVGAPVVETRSLKKYIGSAIDVTEHELLTLELRRREAYLTEAQRLSHTGSFGWRSDNGEIVWSDETYRIFEYDRSVKPTIDSVVQRVHPEDRAGFEEVINRALAGATDFEHAYRLLLPDGQVKHVHALAHVLEDASGNREFVGAVTDITERKTTEDKVRRLVEAGILGIFFATVEGGIVEANQAFLQMLQYDRQDLVSGRLRWADLTPAEWRERDERSMAEFLATGVFQAYEKEYFRKDGSRVPVLVGGARIQSPNEGVVFVLDLSEQKRAEEKIRRSESYLAEAQRLSQTGSWAWSPDDDIRYWSEECYRVLSFDSQDGLPRFEEFFQRIHPDDQPGFRELIETAIREKAEWEADYRIVHPGGAIRDIHVVGHPVLSTSGHLVEFVGTVIDVTERKRAEEERRRSEIELRQILDFAPWHVAVLGADGKAMYLNKAGLDYHGLTREAWQDYDPHRLIHPDDHDRILTGAGQAKLLSEQPFETEARLVRKDGKYRWFLFRFNPLRDGEGRVTRWYVTGTDIEDRKQTEERLQNENVALREEIDKASMFEEIVGTSPVLQTVLSRISKVAPSNSTVLITGETGTGKELVARAIHRRSDRSSRAFVSVNCAVIPRELIASELFGHEKGAFTGATQQRLGRFELASGGTLFLDEVGELPAETQIALLRVLQEHEFERVGGTRPLRADVRVITATNRDLQAAISAGSFRSDLFYRLHVFPIEMPPLRDRKEDIPLLVEYFIDRYARKAGKHFRSVEKRTLQVLQSYPWPGNIRELQNVIERSVIVCETASFSVDESWLSHQPPEKNAKSQLYLSEKVATQEREIIEAALQECQGRVFGPSGAAAKLGIARSTLESKIRSLKINKNRFRA